MEYRIKSYEYIDHKGNGRGISYFIEYKKRFLFFWKRWVAVSHSLCGYGDTIEQTTYFDTLEKAEAFAEKHLCGGEIYDGIKEIIVKESKCK